MPALDEPRPAGGFSEGELAFSGYPELDESYCDGSRGYLRRTVEMITAGPVKIEERQCQRRGDPVCVYWLRWAGRV